MRVDIAGLLGAATEKNAAIEAVRNAIEVIDKYFNEFIKSTMIKYKSTWGSMMRTLRT